MKHFEYVAPGSIKDAVALLQEHSPDALTIAGGTYLLERMKQKLRTPKMLVDLAGLAELQGIVLTDQGLRIGAMVTHTDLISSPLIKKYAPVVATASSTVGGVQIQNLGTVGGNLVSCVPSNDSPPPLLVLDALVTVEGGKGRRQMPLEDLFIKPHCSTLAPDEILLEILIPNKSLGKPACFYKFGRRKALTLALVNAAAWVELDGEAKCFVDCRLALGAVSPTPIRARKAEAFLKGKLVSKDVIAEASQIAAQEANPIDDFRASAQYRRELSRVLIHRVVEGALSVKGN